MPTTEPTTTVFACPDHAPIGVAPEPNDDGRPYCTICGKSNYAVKPFVLKSYIVERGYWRLASYEIAIIPVR